MRNLWVVARRELYAYFVSPIAYLLGGAFLFLCGLFFIGGVTRWQEASLQPMFGSLSIVLIFVAPVLTMRLLARERDQGTIELLLTAPVRDWEVVAGKFLASYLLYLGMVGVTALYVPILVRYSDPDLGAIGAGYLGLVLLGAALLALGVFTSSLTRSQVVAAVIGVGASVGLWLLDLLSPLLGMEAQTVVAYLTPASHYYNLIEGLIDTRDLVYYVSATFSFVFLASQVLESQRWQGALPFRARARRAADAESPAPPLAPRARGLPGARLRGSHALLLSLATIGIVVLLNYLSSRTYERLDLTRERLHSLSPQSIQIVQSLDADGTQPADIEIIGMYPNGADQAAFEKWIDEYRAHSDRISYRIVDPIRQPAQADQLGWDAYGGGLIVRRGNKSQQVLVADEQDITSALLQVSRDAQKVIYFVTGHREHDPFDDQQAGYGDVAFLLQNNNYQVQTLNLAVTGAVPADAAAIVLAGPQTPFLDGEKSALQQYLLQGGKALLLIDPGPETGVNEILAPWQVTIDGRPVIDPWQSLSGDPATPVIDRYAFSQITKDLANMLIALPLASSIQFAGDGETSGTFTALAASSPESWAETDADQPQVGYDEGTDLPGPLTLLATWDATPDPAATDQVQTRMVLVGDSDLASNDILRQIPNGQHLVLNAVNWLAQEEALIAIGPKTYAPQTIRMSATQEGAVCFGSVILIPAAVAVAGILVWLRRR